MTHVLVEVLPSLQIKNRAVRTTQTKAIKRNPMIASLNFADIFSESFWLLVLMLLPKPFRSLRLFGRKQKTYLTPRRTIKQNNGLCDVSSKEERRLTFSSRPRDETARALVQLKVQSVDELAIDVIRGFVDRLFALPDRLWIVSVQLLKCSFFSFLIAPKRACAKCRNWRS